MWCWLCHTTGVDTEVDLSAASREELLGIIASQQAVIAELQRLVEELQGRLTASSRPRGMPGNKISTRRSARRESKPRKSRSRGFGRRRMEPTDRLEHALEACPDCGTPLDGGWTHRTREVIDIPESTPRVTEHVVIARNCPVCSKRRLPRLELGGVALGRQRLGINLMSLVVTLRERARLPIRTIQWYLRTVHGLELSAGGIVRVIHSASEAARRSVAEVVRRIRASPVVFADETGWRQDGVNGFVWTFSTPYERYFVRRNRSRQVVDEVLGDEFGGVLVSDFYAAYNHYSGLKQRCWAHLLRDIHDLRVMHPDDEGVALWASAVEDIYTEARQFSHADARKRSAARRRLEHKLLALCRPYVDDASAVQRKLCRRIERFIKELFVFVAEPYVPSDNNAAERSLRHLVVSRKISGGTRSTRGTESMMTLASLFGTWHARGLNPLVACRQLLASHQL